MQSQSQKLVGGDFDGVPVAKALEYCHRLLQLIRCRREFASPRQETCKPDPLKRLPVQNVRILRIRGQRQRAQGEGTSIKLLGARGIRVAIGCSQLTYSFA